MQVDPRSRQDLGLPIKGTVICVFRHQHMRDGPFTRERSFYQPGRCWCLGDAVRAGPASIFGADCDDHLQLGRNDVEPLGTVLTDLVHRATSARAIQARRLDDLFDPRQVFWQVADVAARGRTFLAR